MQERLAVTSIIGIIALALQKVEWLLFIFLFVLLVDMITYSCVVLKRRATATKKIYKYLWRKFACVIVIVSAGVLDLLIYAIRPIMLSIQFGSSYEPIVCCLVLAWYILSELANIIKNADILGAPIPKFLIKKIEDFQVRLESRVKSEPKNSPSSNIAEDK